MKAKEESGISLTPLLRYNWITVFHDLLFVAALRRKAGRNVSGPVSPGHGVAKNPLCRGAEGIAWKYICLQLLDGSLGGSQTGDGNTEGAAGHVVQADPVAELHLWSNTVCGNIACGVLIVEQFRILSRDLSAEK